ncbi:MAG: pyroglutamyl-peptidase I [Planctomycetota bacterium]|nr:pyroglutamyl-peptidase I [Planctomycetota bacterium]
MILVTGFEPFGGLAQNPSAAVARAVAGGPVEAAVLPVDYEAVGPCLQDLLARPWDAVVLMGVAVGRSALCLERIAINHRDAQRPDNRGHVPAESRIVPGGPAAYFSTLPLERLRDTLAADGLPVEISLSAGAYLCNTSFYIARHTLEDRGTPCGFLHVPPTPDLACGATPLPLDDQIRAVGLILELLG